MMRLRTVVIAGLLASTAAAGIAGADHNGHEFPSAEACMQSGTVFRMPTCSRSGDGPWVARYGPSAQGRGLDGGGAFGTFLFFALLWAAAPAVIGGMVASSRGQSVGLAVLLGIILGWIGLLIVVLTFKPEIATAARNVIDSAASRPPIPTRQPGRDIESRLGQLDRLKAQGLVTEEEYASRRAAILEEL